MQQPRSRIAEISRRLGAHKRRRGTVGIGYSSGLAFAAAQLVDPYVRRSTQQVGARVANRVIDMTQVRKGSKQRVLNEVFGIPDVARQTPSVRVEGRPQVLGHVEIAMPRSSYLVAQGVGSLGITHRVPSFLLL